MVAGAAALGAPGAGYATHVRQPQPRSYRSRRVIADSADIGTGLDLRAGSVEQDGRDLVVGIRTWRRLHARRLGARGGDTLCVVFPRARREVCFNGSHSSLQAATLDAAGAPHRPHSVPADVSFGRRSASARLDPGAAGLRPGRLPWRIRGTSHGRGCPAGTGCVDTAPDSGSAPFRLVTVRPVGCVIPDDRLYLDGPRTRKVVALTFDDGPSPYSPRVVAILRREHVPGTFFLIGRQVLTHPLTARLELAAGNVLGNHSWSHPNLAGGGSRALGEISSTQHEIRRATDFSPCAFRPPDGAVSPALVADAREDGLATINWDVDPRDWSLPGSGAIYSRVVGGARDGSIILMHDGGGPRGETLAALPQVIQTLRRRGYSFTTVPELLGGSIVYRR